MGRNIDADEKDLTNKVSVQWTSHDNRMYEPSGVGSATMPPGLYDIKQGMAGLFFVREDIKTTHLVELPNSTSKEVISEIQTFWSKENTFKKYNVPYKRGIMIYGRPGTGKSSVIRIILEDLFKRGGIALKFSNPNAFEAGFNQFRKVQPNTPVVALMEDLDSLFDYYSDTQLLNILDGVNVMHGVVFLATTNYPDKLASRVLNRPSRFDKLFKLNDITPEDRLAFLESLFKTAGDNPPDLTSWVKDSEGLTLAHLQELFINIVVLGTEYSKAIETVQIMNKGGTLLPKSEGGGTGEDDNEEEN